MILSSIAILNALSILYAVKKHRYDIADVLWGLNILLFCIYFSTSNIVMFDYSSLSILFVFIWGLRLSIHIGMRFLKKTSQDQRYVDLVKSSKNAFFKISKVFLLQIFLAILMSAVFWNSTEAYNLSWNIILGTLLFIFGFGFEVISDNQLKNFVNNPKNNGEICTEGLYSLSRHPNYFGEVVLWWGIWFINGFTLTGLITPVLISFLIVKVSGIPMSERYLSKKNGFDEYAKKTNLFIPWKRK
ncbi:steroid 5-alpha reductase [bacterium]|nr:steroid 5-alpha reductase [bacterium]|tara:strand:- start:6351 stop:7082 length:732 start_codon:yes stop_codon:yes gene_type:complete